MALKISGQEFKLFYNDDVYWPEDAYHEGGILVDGEDQDIDLTTVNDDAIISIDDSMVCFAHSDPIPLQTYFKKWRKKQAVRQIMVQVDSGKLNAVIEAVKAAGGKIVGEDQ